MFEALKWHMEPLGFNLRPPNPAGHTLLGARNRTQTGRGLDIHDAMGRRLTHVKGTPGGSWAPQSAYDIVPRPQQALTNGIPGLGAALGPAIAGGARSFLENAFSEG